ncbi:LAGLIDADG family homing endonuclease [Gracilibacillus phocaeensis]|uniref:LAGLIDADG family homing endonuclease n=1 Tax=Gracilibacillus phocaeensis TaxID=2042304 RepID=UPI00103153B6|nr:LAGLIDADG family homing endonuclease [Gracilibacillus phocaeensis]
MCRRSSKRNLEINEIIKLYEDGESTTEIATIANVSSRYIRMLLKQHHVEMRPRGSWKRKYTLNEDYFKTWSNNMAYILGFIIADGTIARDVQFVSIAQKEKYILEAIREELGSNQPIVKNKDTGVYMLTINSKVMKNDLIEIHGVKPNKSSTIEFPHVPKEYMSHFIRGYFDGDGYINYKQYTVTFVSGSKSFLEALINVLKEKEFTPQFQQQGANYRVHIRGRKSVKLFSDWIYKDKNEGLYLIRKYHTFKEEKLELHQLADRKHVNTQEAIMRRKLNFLTIYALTHSMEYTCACIEIKPASINRWMNNAKLFKRNFEFIKNDIKKSE